MRPFVISLRGNRVRSTGHALMRNVSIYLASLWCALVLCAVGCRSLDRRDSTREELVAADPPLSAARPSSEELARSSDFRARNEQQIPPTRRAGATREEVSQSRPDPSNDADTEQAIADLVTAGLLDHEAALQLADD